MAKLTLNNIASGYATATALNTNNDLVEAAMENTLSLDGTSPNAMSADLDMNSNDILNVNTINTTSLLLNGEAITPSGTLSISAADISSLTHAATDKATPVDADELPLIDSAASFGLKKLTWANLKAALVAYFGTLAFSALSITSAGSVRGNTVAGGSINSAVVGVSSGTGSGVYAESVSGYGINAVSVSEVGVRGASTDSYGVMASSDTTSPLKAAFRIIPQDAQPSGLNLVGDIYVTTAGVLKICTAAGTPGTWVSVGAQT